MQYFVFSLKWLRFAYFSLGSVRWAAMSHVRRRQLCWNIDIGIFFLCRNISLLWITRDIVLSMNEPLVLDLTLTMFTNIVSHPKNSIVDERVEGTEYVPVVNCCVL